MVVLPSNDCHKESLGLEGNRVKVALALAVAISLVKGFFVEVPNRYQLLPRQKPLLHQRDSKCLLKYYGVVADHMAFIVKVMCSGIHLELNSLKLIVELVFTSLAVLLSDCVTTKL